MKVLKSKYLPPALLGLFCIYIFITIASIAEVRMQELYWALNAHGRAGAGGNAEALVARYKLIQKEMGSNKLPGQEYRFEAKTQLMMARVIVDREINSRTWLSVFEPVTIRLLNFTSWLSGSRKRIRLERSKKNEYITLAYYLERSRKFAKAIQVYNKAYKLFAGDDDPEFKAYVYLHRGFSYSIIGRFAKARTDYINCIKTTRQVDVKKAAAKLLSFISSIDESEFKKIDPDKVKLKDAEKMYRHLLYNEAQNVFEKLLTKAKGDDKKRVIYMLGQTNEALGKYKEAAKAYSRLKGKDKISRWANRRMYMMTSFYVRNPKLRKQIKRKAMNLGDDKFLAEVDAYGDKTKDFDLNELRRFAQDEGIFEEGENQSFDFLDFEQEKIRHLKQIQMTIAKLKAELKKLNSKEAKKQFFKANFKVLDRVSLNDGQVFVGKRTFQDATKVQFATEFGILEFPQTDIKGISTINSTEY